MKNRLIRTLTVVILLFSMTINCVIARADAFDDFDFGTADAGASQALAEFFKTHENASEIIQGALAPIVAINGNTSAVAGADLADNGEEVLYDDWKLGIVCTEGSLNVRESTTTLSAVAAQVFHGLEVYVTGEKLVNGNLWYKVKVMDVDGYALATYIRFGEDAEAYLKDLAIRNGGANGVPDGFELRDNISNLPQEVQDDLKHYADEANYCLVVEYPKAKSNADALSQYAILVYLMEIYQHIGEICDEYGLNETAYLIDNGKILLEHEREELSNATGQTEQDFINGIIQVQEQAKAEAAYSLGANIANQAAAYIGILPYVWGGASLVYGADCSGFCSQIYAMFGLLDQAAANVHAYDSTALRGVGHEVSIAEIQPGDLICYNGHVAIYYGDGVMVHAPRPGRCVEFGSLYLMPIITIRRLY